MHNSVIFCPIFDLKTSFCLRRLSFNKNAFLDFLKQFKKSKNVYGRDKLEPPCYLKRYEPDNFYGTFLPYSGF